MKRDRYKEAGVDIEAGNEVVRRVRARAERTRRPEVLDELGGFGGLFGVPRGRYRDLVLVSGTDGVGTKLVVARLAGRHQSVGVDLVAMCVNDVVVTGAEPWFFLDYFATGALDPDVAVEVIAGVADGCLEAGCALIGGETAEMPSMYPAGEYDLAGFAVGGVERSRMLDPSSVTPGMALVGLASSGLHSNGYSLVRHLLLDGERMALDAPVEALGRTLAEELLQPTRIYVRPLLAMIEALPVAAAAHITGGGLLENVPRALPRGCAARVRRGSWAEPPVFDLLRRSGQLDEHEMLRTFNCGVGMVVMVPRDHADDAVALAGEHGAPATVIGEVISHDDEPSVQLVGARP